MKHVKAILFFTLFISISLTSCQSQLAETGINYYIDSEHGNDSNDGTSPQSAWKSLEKANSLRLQAGDNLLFRRGSHFTGQLNVSAQGTSANRIVIGAYGSGSKPCFSAPDNSLYTICIANSSFLTLQDLDVVNTGSSRMPNRTGVKVVSEDYGWSRGITLHALDIHDVNGSLLKKAGGGSAILIESLWKTDSLVSLFDSLTIEDCTIRRCERNAIIWNAPWSRSDWHLSTHTIVRRNLIEEVPGDGIVPIGCDSALVEYNLMRRCSRLLPLGEAAAGIWPWSCDNTTIQFNEVSDHKAPWDGQGFDSDFNCTNTLIQYNYSHDNEGGFILICNPGNSNPADNIGNLGSIVRYNVSIDDAVRQQKTHTDEYFSPTIHIGGPCKNTLIEHNILHIGRKPGSQVDRTTIASLSWEGYADSTTIRENLFFAPEPSAFNLTKSTNNLFEKNYYLGTFQNMPVDSHSHDYSAYYESIMNSQNGSSESLSFLFEDVTVGDGAAVMKAVRKDAITEFFKKITSNQ